jgi:glycosyltransferase involved in cell wall biosynthesis
LRILEFIDRLDSGGAESMVACLALRLRQIGHEVHVVCLRDFGQMNVPAERFSENEVSLVEFGKTDGFSPAFVWKLARYLTEKRIDVIHSHNPLVTHYAAAASAIARIPVAVSTIHGTSTLGMARWAERLFSLSCMRNDRIVLVCKQVEQIFRQRYSRLRKRTAVIPNGIDVEGLLSVKARSHIQNEFVFGTIGRLAPVKDHSTLLIAFERIHKQFPFCRLEILGCGELLDDLRWLAASLGIESAVKFHGWSRDIAGFLGSIDAFVISSKSEGLPMTLLESMAAGVPVVATAVGGIPEVLETAGCGWLATPGDPVDLSEKMRCVMNAPDRFERGRRGRQAVLEQYSVESMAAQYEKLFVELASGR